ncbi:MAG: hypothetical protein GY940_33940, partial [bacterium]|nr:hypothetical protein [bacterium]
YDEKDGMGSRECNGVSQPAGWKDYDGKLWFPTMKGLAMIDPVNVKTNPLPPQVRLEDIIVENRKIHPSLFSNRKELVLPPGKERIEIRYAALSFRFPRRIRFKFRLQGFDKYWQDVGNRRTAYYTGIPPGNYTFRVIACNNDGIWNETGASLSLYFKPWFYQTTWFYFLCILGFVLIGFVVS